MRSTHIGLGLLLSLVVALSACGETVAPTDTTSVSDTVEAVDGSIEDTAQPPVITCDESLTPIVFVHGFLASGDTWASYALRFMANGYCPQALVAFDWNSIDNSTDWSQALDVTVDAVLADTGASQIYLVGHSAGAGLTYSYLSTPERAAKVNRYVYAGYGPQAQAAGPSGDVPTLYLWSKGDTAMRQTGEMPGATTVILDTADHYAVVCNEESFAATYEFLIGEAPEVTSWDPVDSEVNVWGKSLAFAENTPTPGTVFIQATDPQTGLPSNPENAKTLEADAQGYWGPVMLPTQVPLQYTVTPADGSRPVHYFREPLTTANPLVYVRTLPTGASLAGMLLSGLPFDDKATILVVFSASRALLFGQDSLTVNGQEVLSEATASASNTTIALFFYDENEDGTSGMTPIGLYGSFPFLAGLDMHLDAKKAEPIVVKLNDRELRVPRLGSDTHGVTVVVFD